MALKVDVARISFDLEIFDQFKFFNIFISNVCERILLTCAIILRDVEIYFIKFTVIWIVLMSRIIEN